MRTFGRAIESPDVCVRDILDINEPRQPRVGDDVAFAARCSPARERWPGRKPCFPSRAVDDERTEADAGDTVVGEIRTRAAF